MADSKPKKIGVKKPVKTRNVEKKRKTGIEGRGSGNAPSSDVEPLNQYVCQRIKHLRKRKNWTLQQLADSSGVSRSMLSQIERGAANPTLSVTFRIARAFGLSLADLVDGAADRKRIEVIRRDDQNAIFRDDAVCKVRTLSPLNLEKDVEFYELTLKPGQRLESAAHFEGTREFLTVQSGTLRIESGDEYADLRKGDSVQYVADVDHAIVNNGKTSATAFLVDIYRAEN